MRRRSLITAASLAAASPFLPRLALAQGASIVGGGAVSPRQAYEKWAQLAQAALGIQMTYQGSNSNTGADQVVARQVDFAGTDNPKRPGMLREQHLIQFPAVLSAYVPVVNLPGVQPNQLKLTGELLADLFLGKITKWNDKKLAAENAGLRLPDMPVVPVHRADPSGPTYYFTTYLTRVSEAWAQGPRASNKVNFPTGQSVTADGGMIEKVKATPGAIGYTGASNAKSAQLATVSLRNRAGAFVAADAAAFAKAAEAGDWSAPGFVTEMVDLEAEGAWPIVTPTFILMPSNPEADKVTASLNTMKFFDWAFSNAGEATTGLGFVPLPAALHDSIKQVWRRVKGPDGKPIWEA
ncbi:phosphate ABC transporter substrate-binding protein PstS [Craurococcus roseus]|uniref:phosphate ABC transporter substrate-binding protein PstS n=1 Tax=Craurococcus roseus TaxID=77585 RepID=UPI0031E482F3